MNVSVRPKGRHRAGLGTAFAGFLLVLVGCGASAEYDDGYDAGYAGGGNWGDVTADEGCSDAAASQFADASSSDWFDGCVDGFDDFRETN